MTELPRRSFLATAAISAGVLGARTSFGGGVANRDELLGIEGGEERVRASQRKLKRKSQRDKDRFNF